MARAGAIQERKEEPLSQLNKSELLVNSEKPSKTQLPKQTRKDDLMRILTGKCAVMQ